MSIYGCYTTVPHRLNFTSAVNSFLRQTVPIKTIYMSVPQTFHNYSGEMYYTPNTYNKKLKILKTPYDFGPATKVLGCYKHVPDDSYLFVIDDDIEYLPDLLETLYDYRSPVVSFDTCSAATLGGICGFEGYLIKKNYLNGIEEFYKTLPKECLYVDDMWLGLYFNYTKTPVKYIQSLKHSVFTRVQSWKSTFFDNYSLSHNTLSHTIKNKICFDLLKK